MSWPVVVLVVCLVLALVAWDIGRRYAGKVATSALRADLTALRAEIAAVNAGPRLQELEDRVANLSTLVEARRTSNMAGRRLGGL